MGKNDKTRKREENSKEGFSDQQKAKLYPIRS
jgi:hypothetical protein